MHQALIALLVSEPAGTCLQLKRILEEEEVHVRLAHSCAEVRKVLEEFALPSVIFSDAALSDGSWPEVLNLANHAPRPVPVIVVSRTVNIDLYINALEKGAADFIVPPFYRQDIDHVLCCAARKGPGSFDCPDRTFLAN